MQLDLADAMKQAMRHWVSGIAIVATCDAKGRRFGMTVSSMTSLSDSPPSLLVCLNKATHTYNVLQTMDGFSVNILGVDQQPVSNQFAMGDDNEMRFAQGHWQNVSENNVPYLVDALCNFVCAVDQRIKYGSHCIVIGKIQQVIINEQEKSPLLYGFGAYQSLGEK